MSERIFIADDDPDIVQFVSVNLQLEGFEVSSATDGKAALAALTKDAPDLVILDIMMPEMDGLAVLRRMRAHPVSANIPVIVLTAKALPQDRIRGLELGADDYISKPFELDELMVRVRTVLQRAKAMRDLSPLTGLPGNFRITQELERRTESGEPYALVHADLDNFKAFNDHYGFMRGDGVRLTEDGGAGHKYVGAGGSREPASFGRYAPVDLYIGGKTLRINDFPGTLHLCQDLGNE